MNCKEVKAKWRTCPVGGLAPVSPTDTYIHVRTSAAGVVVALVLQTVSMDLAADREPGVLRECAPSVVRTQVDPQRVGAR